MLEIKDPAIKLFGMRIPLPADWQDFVDRQNTACDPSFGSKEEKKVSRLESREETDTKKESVAGKGSKTKQNYGGSTNMQTSPGTTESSESPSINEETSKTVSSNPEKDQSESTVTNSEEKQITLKKPDKILPCPRCKSMETKFCYYNNYNVHQPRHFCKSCQRYWTAGGTMRNVPVGAGRRKNKNSASRYGHVTISDALQTARMDSYPNRVHNHPAMNCNGTVLSFGSDASIPESVASVLDLEQPFGDRSRNGFQGIDKERIPNSFKVGEIGGNLSIGSSITASNSIEECDSNCAQVPLMPNLNGFPAQIPCPYPWNSAIPPPCFPYPGFAYLLPSSFNGTTNPNTWSIPWFQKVPSSNSDSSTLGKHSRNGNLLKDNSESVETPKQENTEKCIWVPKTLRIDDPEEAAKSSIWETLGIQNDSISRVGLFKGFQQKGNKKDHDATSPALSANPAAWSRSLNFHESSLSSMLK